MADPHSHSTDRPPHPLAGWDVIEQAGELARLGEEFALATVVWRQGPSSGQQGARAIVTADGRALRLDRRRVRRADRASARRSGRSVERRAALLLLGTPEQFGGAVPDGMIVIPIACQSEGALEVYVEPVGPDPHLVIVGRSPMAHTLGDLARALGWRAELVDVADFSAAERRRRERRRRRHPGPRRRGRGPAGGVGLPGLRRAGRVTQARPRRVLGYLADRGVPQHLLDRVHAPVGLDLGHTSHREIAVAILAELVRERAAGDLAPATDPVACLLASRWLPRRCRRRDDRARPGLRDDRAGGPVEPPGRARRHHVLLLLRRLPGRVRGRPGVVPLIRQPGRLGHPGGLMLIKSDFEVAQSARQGVGASSTTSRRSRPACPAPSSPTR